ncbi:hypothetical protein M404DRAFT_993682 [Pisolithus tinctorius Marx 270]|uniref:CID domain-containing protein n=1 Tax=Pisolithus tinctorius Marx 270 TaxID=870435 RepID=A0A0C3PFM3_PISTI|nr:hypothetical protein M404DRAFT_993682 [Pisolithus tinctorius Marx 270]
MSSMYSQVPAYSQGIYPPAPGYQQPAGPSYPYPQLPSTQPQAPVYHVDPNSFRRDFATRLAELTINSRPIIQSLSMYAQEYSRWADVVAQCIHTHIRRVPPWMKLPAFYLLDAISKNVFEPYARHFATFVISLFLETYQQVDQPTRSKMEEMLITWRTGAPNGKELFGVITQLSVERGIWGGDSSSPADASSPTYPSTISKAQVLSELEFTLGQKDRALQANPWDVAVQKHVEVLHQLRNLVEAGVSQDELRQILNQLRSLTRTTPQVQPPPSSSYPTHPTQSTHTRSYPHYHGAPAAPSTYSHQSEQPKPVDISTLLPAASSSTSTSPLPSTNIATLYNALLKAGVVSAGGASSTNHLHEVKLPETNTAEYSRDASRAYRKAVLSEKVKLTTADILKKRSSVVDLLYNRLPVQCKQCGLRFSHDACGKKQMDDHLDMHFKQNSGVGQNVGRGHSRCWFVSLEDWTRQGTIDVKGKGRVDGPRSLSKKLVDAAQRDAELRAQFVVVPPGDEAKSIYCPICKETLKSEFLEDDEEWVWRNAIRKDDKIYHATCHSEAATSALSLAARLRNDGSSRSRSRTPEVSALRSTPPRSTATGPCKSQSASPDTKRATLKRKVDDEGGLPSAVSDGTPAAKKLALAV